MAQTSGIGIDLAMARLEAALERACGALVVLESMRSHAAYVLDDVRDVNEQVRVVVSEIRAAVEELANVRNQRASVGALGFVAASELVRERSRSCGLSE
jgi:hypothetical protein